MEKILSNEAWFVRLVYLRAIGMLAIIAVALLLMTLDKDSNIDPSGLWRGVVVSLLLTAALWQILQKPSYLEVISHQNALLIRIYIPDNGSLFVLRREHIRTFIVYPEDELRIHGQYGRWPWSRKLQFAIVRPDGSQWRSEVMDISWASYQDWERLQQLPKQLCA